MEEDNLVCLIDYIMDILSLSTWESLCVVVQFYYGQCKVRVDDVLKIFNREYDLRVGQQKQAMEKVTSICY